VMSKLEVTLFFTCPQVQEPEHVSVVSASLSVQSESSEHSAPQLPLMHW
jgi:hypothetical protein